MTSHDDGCDDEDNDGNDDPFRLELICHFFAKLSLTPGGLSLA